MPPRTRRFLREIIAQSVVLLAGAAIFGGGVWAATRAWNGGQINLPSAVAATLLLVVGGLVLWTQVGALRESVKNQRALPPLRRLPTAAEVAAYRATIDQALAAIAAARRETSCDFDFGPLEATLQRDHADAVEVLRESVATGYGRWLSGELGMESWGPAYAAVCAAASAVSRQHARSCQPPPA